MTKKEPAKVPKTGVDKEPATKEAPSKVPIKKAEKRTLSRVLLTAIMMIWVFCSVVASQLVVGYLMLWLLGSEALGQPVWSGVYAVGSYLLALILIIIVPPRLFEVKWRFRRKDGRVSKGECKITSASREQLGLSGTPTWTDIGLSPIAFVVSTIGAGVLLVLFRFFPWFDATQAQETGFAPYMASGEKVIAFITLVVLAPIVEEVIFRGWLYGKMRARLNLPISILLTSLLFAVMHFQWNVGVNVFALSVVLCGLREITGTIYAGILTHMIKNGVAFYLLYVLHM